MFVTGSKRFGSVVLRATTRDINQFSRGFSTLYSSLEDRVNNFPTKDAVRFFDQDLRWSLASLKQHSEAVAYGLTQLGFEAGNSTLTACLPANAENLTTCFGGAFAGVNVAAVSGCPTSAETLKKILKETGCRGIVVSSQDMNTIYEAIPELLNSPGIMDSTLDLEEFPNLKYVFHTGHAVHKGTHRFKDILVYYPSIVSENLGSFDSFTLSVIESDSGKVKQQLNQQELLTASEKAAGELSLSADNGVVFGSKSSVPDMFVGSVACMLNLAKFVVPSELYDEEKLSQALEIENCQLAIGDSAPSSVKAWSS